MTADLNRPLFFYERFAFAGGESWNINLAVRLRGPLDETLLRSALDAMQRRHPSLRAGVEPGARPRFVTAAAPPAIPLVIEHRHDDATWLDIAWAERRRPFARPGGPLVRLLWIRPPPGGSRCELVLVCHHCLCDGQSVVILMRDLLRCLADPQSAEPPFPPHATLAKLLPAAGRQPITARLTRGAVIAASRALLPAARLLPGRRHGEDHFLRWEMNEATATALARSCRAERTTVTLALAVATLRAFAATNPGGWRNRLICPIDLRPLLPGIGRDRLFPIADAVGLSLDETQPAFWTQVRLARAAMMAAKDRMDPVRTIEIGERLHPVAGDLVTLQRNGRIKQDVAFAHLGRLDLPEGSGPLTLDGVPGGFGAMPWRDGTGLFAMRDNLRIVFMLVSRDDLLARETALQIRDHMMATIGQECGSRAAARDGLPVLARHATRNRPVPNGRLAR